MKGNPLKPGTVRKFVKGCLVVVAALGGFFGAANSGFAQTWTQTSAPTNLDWVAVASSADGNKLFAAANAPVGAPLNEPDLYTSTDSGATWMVMVTSNLPTGQWWKSVASSADGTVLLAIPESFWPYVSTNSGTTWTRNQYGPSDVTGAVCSADGKKFVATSLDYSTYIYSSTNSGATWTYTIAPDGSWTTVASSADGTTLVGTAGAQFGEQVYISTNAGALWIKATNAPIFYWSAVACSADGTKAVVVTPSGGDNPRLGIYLTTNFGMTWTQATNAPPSKDWNLVASSADGTKLVAATGIPSNTNGQIYTSSDSGITWVSNNVPKFLWTSVASSADGGKLVAVANHGGGIWTLQSASPPKLNITSSNANLALSWIMPSTNFVLQQNLDLNTTNWVDMTNMPVLDLTNLQDEVTFPLTDSSVFFRLKSE